MLSKKNVRRKNNINYINAKNKSLQKNIYLYIYIYIYGMTTCNLMYQKVYPCKRKSALK